MLISLVFNGFMYVSEERLLDKYYMEPFEIVGQGIKLRMGIVITKNRQPQAPSHPTISNGSI